MKVKHTPGPWTYEYGAAYHVEKGRLILADRENDKTLPTERDANVRLCAAAPDLLAACKLVQSLLAISPDGRGINWEGPVVDNLKAAIAKAQGEA